MPSRKAIIYAITMAIFSYYGERFSRVFRKTKFYRLFRLCALRPLLSLFLFRYSYRVWPTDKRRHQYIVAGTGNGKSEYIKVLIWEELRKPVKKQSAVVLLDPHGDLAEETARFREFGSRKYARRLVYIDPMLQDGFYP